MASSDALPEELLDPSAGNYGFLEWEEINSKVSSGRTYTRVNLLKEEMQDSSVLLRGRVHAIRRTSTEKVSIILRQRAYTVLCLLRVGYGVSPQMINFASELKSESFIIVDGVVSVPISGPMNTSQMVEVHVRRVYCLQLVTPDLPFTVEDASRSQSDIEELLKESRIENIHQTLLSLPLDVEEVSEKLVEIEGSVQSQEKKLRITKEDRSKHMVIQWRTPSFHSIQLLKSEVEGESWRFLGSQQFRPISSCSLLTTHVHGLQTPLDLDSFGEPSFLDYTPHFSMQIALVYIGERVFDTSSSLKVEMNLHNDYSEVLDIVDRLFVAIFDHLNNKCTNELSIFNRQYPFEQLKFLRTTLKLTFDEGVEMLKASGVNVDPLGDLSTEAENKLCQLVLEKYDTEFYILHRCPLAARPFYNVPCVDNENYCCTFDAFMRGVKIICDGGQHANDADMLIRRAEECRMDINTISPYLDFFRNNTVRPHCGFEFEFQQFIKLFCNILDTMLVF